MTKKAIVSLDLASWAGTLNYVPGPQLPRHDIALLERTIAATFFAHLSQRDGSTIENIESNATDPPDVTFTYNGLFRGLELSELVLGHRYEKDAIIRGLRREIISQLELSEKTAGFVVTIFLADDYDTEFRPGKIGPKLANVLAEFFDRSDPRTEIIRVPDHLQDVVTGISVFRENLTGDPRLNDPREPLIVFGAQNTMLIPEDDCPAIVEARLSEKCRHDYAFPTWLLLWSNHPSFAQLRVELDNAIGRYLRSRPIPYERVFHLHLFPGSGATEFPKQPRQIG